MDHYQLVEFVSDDGLRLFARDYNCTPGLPVVLCLHGLTRNSADFEPLCDVLAPHYRLIVPDQRGRGLSDNDSDPANYQPLRYNEDMLLLLDHLNLACVHIIGTSMGGIMGMLLAESHPQRIASLVLNDIGPEIRMEGVRAIAAVVKTPVRFRSWESAYARVEQAQKEIFPDFKAIDWQAYVRRTCRETDDGIVPDFDPAIGRTFADAGDTAAPNLWPVFEALTELPMLVIRGDRSNLLSRDCCQRMQAMHPNLALVEVPNRGHAPILDEAVAVDAICSFLDANAK